LSTGIFMPCCVTSHTGPTFSVTSMRRRQERNPPRQLERRHLGHREGKIRVALHLARIELREHGRRDEGDQ
jgi:hypothetical protein